MGELYKRWNLESLEIPKRIYIENAVYDSSGLTVNLKDADQDNGGDKTIRIFFDAPTGYRNFDESDRYRFLLGIPDSTLRTTSLFLVENSRWVRWICDESGLLQEEDLTHYAILTIDDCFEVISKYPPQVKAMDYCSGGNSEGSGESL